MAKIEMDLSEFDAMRETKKQLEKSLETERALTQEIKKLQEDKIKALDDAKMKVLKKRIERVDQFVMLKRNPQDLMRRLEGLMHTRVPHSMLEYETQSVVDCFFERKETRSVPVTEEVTLVGLDEVKAEIRQELKDQIDETTNAKIAGYDSTVKLYQDCKEQLQALQAKYENVVELNGEYSRNLLTDEHKVAIEKFDKIRDVMKNGYSLFNYGSILSYIKSLM